MVATVVFGFVCLGLGFLSIGIAALIEAVRGPRPKSQTLTVGSTSVTTVYE